MPVEAVFKHLRTFGLVVVTTTILYGCSTLVGEPKNESCADLVDDIIQLSQDAEVSLTEIVGISKLSIPGKRLSCKGMGMPADGSRLPIEFYEWEDTGGQVWVEYKDLRISEWECDYFVDAVTKLSEDEWARNPFQSRIVKIYDPEKVSHTHERLTCKGVALLDNLDERDIKFYTWFDKDGDRFYGYEVQ